MAEAKKNIWKPLQLFILSIGPGLFIIGYNIGTGSVTTMAVTGAEYGMALMWPVLISCILTYILILVFGRFTVVTGDTVIHSYKKHFGKSAALFVLIALIFTESMSMIGVMAIVTQVVQEWSRPLTETGKGINPIITALFFMVILYALFLNGKQNFFEKVLAVFVGVMGLSFLLTMIMVIPDPIDVIYGLVPKVPDNSNAFLLIAGMVGTTMGAVIFVVRSILIKGKGWGIADLKLEKRDALISAALMFFLSVAVMASAAGTLFTQGIKIDNAIDMVHILEPLAGRFALSIFVGGIIAAGLSSIFPNMILAPMLFADYNGKLADMNKTSNRLIVLSILSLGLVVPIFGGRPVFVMIASQAFIAVATPLVILFMMILMNRKSVVGETYVLSPIKNILVGVTLIFSTMMAVFGIIGLFGW
jgi:Mn2+/Fe2+ NRAMP family transporter